MTAGAVDTATVPALLRACLAGDELGAAAIVDTVDPVVLTFALCAWANQMRGRADFAEVAEYDGYLAQCQAVMRGDAPGLPGS